MKLNIFDKNNTINIIIAGILSLFIGVGVARFSYTSLLPFMLSDNALSLHFSGVLASINYAGYLAGSIFAIFIKDIHRKIKLFRVGVFLCLVTTLVLGVSDNHIIWLISRIIAGFGAAMILVVGAAIVMAKLNLDNKSKAMGLYFTGIGFSIVLSDLLARLALSFGTWQDAWLLLSLAGFLVMSYPLYILSIGDKNQVVPVNKNSFNKVLFTPFVLVLITAYFTAGIGFVVTGTFLPTILQSLPGLENIGGIAWLLVGIFAIPATIIWMNLADRYGSVNIIMLVIVIQTVGILIPTISHNIFLNLLGGAIYGITFAPLVALFMHLGGKLAGDHPVVLMGALTTAYGVGQVTGPLYAVALTTWQGNYNYALYVTASIVFFGALILFIAQRYKETFA